MNKLTRYDKSFIGLMEQTSKGEWVRYSDVAHVEDENWLLEEKVEKLEELNSDIYASSIKSYSEMRDNLSLTTYLGLLNLTLMGILFVIVVCK